MIEAARTDEPDYELKTIPDSLPISPTNRSSTSPKSLKRARIICAAVYVLLQTFYFIFIIVCIALYPSCEKAAATPWWINSVFIRFSSRTMQLNDFTEKLNDYKSNYGMQALWLSPVIPLSKDFNPMQWRNVAENIGGDGALTNLIIKAHENDVRILVDYPINHLSVLSTYFNSSDDSYFVWNEQGNISNWLTVNNQRSAWTYNNRKNSYYLNQFDSNADSVDINYRNNRVFNDIIDSVSYWNNNFQLDGLNLQGISYAYEDYQYRNEINNQNPNQTRHLDEDYLLLARIRVELDKSKILLLDALDSLATSNEQLLARYYGNEDGYLGGVQLASLNNFILVNESVTNIISLFDKYYSSAFFETGRPFVWASLSTNSQLNEAFFAACLFHIGAISIDVDRQGAYFSSDQLERLRQVITFARTLDVFRVGRPKQQVLPSSQLLTIERARRGSRHHMIIINFSNTNQEDTIQLKDGITSAVEVLLSNIADPGTKYEKNALLDMSNSIRLRPYEYIIIRWSPSIDGLKIIF